MTTFPLSTTQQAIWFDQLLAPQLPCYNIGGALRFEGTIRLDLWERAIAQFVRDNEAMRLVLVDGQPIPAQAAPDDPPFTLACHDYAAQPDGEALARAHLERAFMQPFDLHAGRLWEMQWVQATATRGWCLFRFHHLMADGSSVSLIGNGILDIYNRLVRGEAVGDDPAPAYRDFVADDLAYLDSPRYERDRAFWFERFARNGEALFERESSQIARHRCEQVVWTIPRAEHDRWAESLAALGCSTTHLLTAALAVYFARVAGGRAEVIVGTPVHNRKNAAEKRTVGMFASVLPLAVPVDPHASFAATLQAVAAESKTCFRHQRFPLYEIARELQKNPLRRSRLFDLTVSVENFAGDLTIEGGRIAMVPWHNGHEAVALALYLRNYEKTADVTVEFNVDPSVMGRGEVEAAVRRIECLVRAGMAAPDTPLWRLPLLDAAERRQVIVDFNATRQAWPEPAACIHQLFERRAAAQPDALAVEDDTGARLGYGELNAKANRLARRLVSLGVRPDDRVAVALPRGADLLVALLAVFKAGGCYLPLDLDYPAERIAAMLEDSAPRVLVARPGAAMFCAAPVIDVEAGAGLADHDLDPRDLGLTDRHLAYMIYTSGSTGRPKGVMVEHRGLVNYTLDALRWFGLAPDERVLQQNSLNFDLSLEEMLPALAAGATLVARNEPLGVDGADAPVTMLHLTAAHWHTLVSQWAREPERAQRALRGVRLINVTGEALSVARLEQWTSLKPEFTGLINTYGPTEATISCSAQAVRFEPGMQRAGIGRPFANTQIYILDAQGEPVPVGVAGEIHIAGQGVARGYLNRPELTAERFVPDPFSTEPGARLYKSGDLGRWKADGTIEYLGRRDQQVKVRGFRIELEEIEARLLDHAGVREAVVAVREDLPGDKRLVAYTTGEPIDPANLREHLARTLPEFMVPAAYVHLAALPLSPNGKLDRAALAAPGDTAFGTRDHEPPQGPVETALAAIWRELLGVERIGRHDGFFELGGHSLLAVQMVQAASRAGIERPVGRIFRTPTLAGFAAESGGPLHAVAVRREGRARPLFVMHMQSGHVNFAFRLPPYIDPEIPLYGLPGPRNEDAPITTIEAAAADLLRMLRAVQPRGPYRLLGWSFGGVLAYELAGQLLAAGESVEFLGIVDTPLRPPTPASRSLDEDVADIDGWLPDIARDADALAAARALLAGLPGHAAWEDRFGALRREAQSLFNVIAAPVAQMKPVEAHQWLRHWRARARAGAAYACRALPLAMDLFVSAESVPAGGPWLGWEALYPTQRLRVSPIRGPHGLLMNEPYVATTGAAVSAALQRLNRRPPEPRHADRHDELAERVG